MGQTPKSDECWTFSRCDEFRNVQLFFNYNGDGESGIFSVFEGTRLGFQPKKQKHKSRRVHCFELAAHI